MEHYLDFNVRASEVCSRSQALSAIFLQLHLVLVEEQSNNIGISFPRAEKDIGTIIRVHGDVETLTALSQNFRLQKLRDYYLPPSIVPVPAEHQWCRVSRRQPAMSWSKARRMVKRGTLKLDEAEALCQRRGQLSEPYIALKSLSSGQMFKLFVDQQILEAKPSQPQTFNTYGLGGTVPWF